MSIKGDEMGSPSIKFSNWSLTATLSMIKVRYHLVTYNDATLGVKKKSVARRYSNNLV